jgi:hypothetical protein
VAVGASAKVSARGGARSRLGTLLAICSRYTRTRSLSERRAPAANWAERNGSAMTLHARYGPPSRFGTPGGIAAPARPAPPTLPRDLSTTIGAALAPIAVCVFVTAVPVLFHLASQAAGIASCVLLALLVAAYAAPSVPAVLIFSYLFQNLFVALVSPHIDSMEELNAIRGYNFLLTVGLWCAFATQYLRERPSFDPRLRRVVDVSTGALVLIGAYFMFGLTTVPNNAVVYLRNISAPFLLLQIFAVVGHRHRVSLGALTLIAVLALLYGYLELVARDALLQLVNGDVYITKRIREDFEAGVWLRDLQETGRVMRSYLDTLATDFLNTPMLQGLGLRFYRLVGPNFHSISFAYALAVLGVMLAAAGRGWYAVLTLPLILVIGSKGALILLLLVGGTLALIACLRTFPLWPYVAVLCVYAGVGIWVGINTQDYHVIGFIGGVRGFFANPFGHGIGVGGNLTLSVSALDWSRSQMVGHTDVAVESATGVLLYQLGFAALLVLGVLGWVALRLWSLYRRTGDRLQAAAALAILTLLANGIFQEEALFAPLALGMVAAFAGLVLGAAYRVPGPKLPLRA